MSPVRPASQSWIIIANVRSTSDRGDASVNVIKVTLLLTELLLRDYRTRYWTFDTWTYYDLIRHAANYRLAGYYHATLHPLIMPICYRRVNRALLHNLPGHIIRINDRFEHPLSITPISATFPLARTRLIYGVIRCFKYERDRGKFYSLMNQYGNTNARWRLM